MINVVSKDVLDALTKKALGFTTEEIIEEYQESDGEQNLTKRKVTKKEVPPDMTALKILLEEINEKSVKDMSDQEILEEKNRLLLLLKSLDESK